MAVPLALDETGPWIAWSKCCRDPRAQGETASGARQCLPWQVVARLLLKLVIAQRVNVTTASIPGPRRLPFLAGAPVLEVFPVLPLVGNEPIGVGAVSYADTFNIGIAVDHDAVPDLEVLAAGVGDELAALVEATAVRNRHNSLHRNHHPDRSEVDSFATDADPWGVSSSRHPRPRAPAGADAWRSGRGPLDLVWTTPYGPVHLVLYDHRCNGRAGGRCRRIDDVGEPYGRRGCLREQLGRALGGAGPLLRGHVALSTLSATPIVCRGSSWSIRQRRAGGPGSTPPPSEVAGLVAETVDFCRRWFQRRNRAGRDVQGLMRLGPAYYHNPSPLSLDRDVLSGS